MIEKPSILSTVKTMLHAFNTIGGWENDVRAFCYLCQFFRFFRFLFSIYFHVFILDHMCHAVFFQSSSLDNRQPSAHKPYSSVQQSVVIVSSGRVLMVKLCLKDIARQKFPKIKLGNFIKTGGYVSGDSTRNSSRCRNL